ncbi:DUF5695 domain-containing protein [Paenibacillus harenae]|uniref:F5/8 type C domain-containing protein n=1 Tax=Paenibacillus harenae TaxID=306543 RepID=A0ABT9U649_PAEHA|nr:DUF5695 domain-containing protein [Paenibacillus harenae]MDQ0114175.1 hypothetical protein [Paenibacillus harenae]
MWNQALSLNRRWILLAASFFVTASFLILYPQIASAYTLSDNNFNITTGTHGEINSLRLVGDAFNTQYVMNPTVTPNQNTADHQWLGELMFKYRFGTGAWQTAMTQSSADVRTQTQSGNTVTITYQNSTNANGIRNFKLVNKYSLVNDYFLWEFEMTNTGTQTIEFGDVGLPLPFNEFWTGGNNEQIYESRVLTHSFVGNNSSYITVGRPSGIGPSLLMVPDASTGAGFEYQDRWRTEEHPGSMWAMEQGGWIEGLNVFYIHSNVIKSTNRGYLPNTSLTLAPGASKKYAFKFFKVQGENQVKDRLYNEGHIDVTVVPGMMVPTDQTAKFDLHTTKTINSVVAQYPSETTITSLGTTGTNHKIYSIQMNRLGPNNVTVNYGNGEKTVLQFYAIEPIGDALQRHSTFMVNSTQWNVPGDIRDKVFDDWMMNTNSKRNVFNGYWGWGDDWGLTHGQFLAEKNVQTPIASEVQAVDDYLTVAIWGNLMGEHQTDYLIHDFLMPDPNDTPTYRGYAYPHIYNTYFSMYKIAKLYPDLITYDNPRNTYLLRAYNIFNALYGSGVAYNWNTGLMGELTTPEIIKALQDEGYTTQANNLIAKMATKYNNFANTTYPYGSEYNYDNTGEEAVYTLAKMNNNNTMKSKINTKTRAARGHMPVWYYYTSPVTITGENWWNFQYTVSLAGYAMDDWIRYHSTNPEVEQRLSYAAKIANVGAINSGQISSDPADIGAVAWTYQAEKGNYPALGHGGGPLQNGWRGMSGEADLGLFGAIKILSSDVAVDPIFGVFCYGCDVANSSASYTVVPKDGVFQRLNLITEKFGMELERDKYTTATVAKAKNALSFTLKSTTPGTAHTTKVALRGLAAGSYNILVNNVAVGSVNAVNNVNTTINLNIGTAATYNISLQQGTPLPNSAPVVDAGSNGSFTLPALLTLAGTVTDDGLPSGTVTTAWTMVSGPGTATIANSAAANTTATVTMAGTYVFQLTASDGSLSANDTVTHTVNPAVPIPEVIASYAFNETSGSAASDASGNGKHASLSGGTSWSAGKSGNGLELNGSNAYASLPAGIVEGLNDFTIATWVKVDTLSDWARIFDFGTGTNNYMFLAPRAGGAGLRFGISTSGNGAEQQLNAPALPTGVWKHVAVTLSGTTGRLYVDGVLATTNTAMTLKPSSLGSTDLNYIGKSQWPDPYLDGMIDDFKIYSRALNGTEIGTLFSGSPTAADIAPLGVASTSFVSTWESLAGLNDGYTPASSSDRGHPVYGNWNNPNTTQWVQYDFLQNYTISSVDVYWFDDGGGIDLPASYTIQYWDGSAWVNAASPSGLGILADHYNTTTFTPVSTNKIRLNVTAKATTSTGISSWKVTGY